MTDEAPTAPETPEAIAAASAQYVLATAPIGAKAFDTVARVTAGQAAALYSAGFRVAFRYAVSITVGELADLTGAGHLVSFVMYSPPEGYTPHAADAVSAASRACAALHALGVPSGIVVWIDAEGMGGTPDERIAYINAAADTIIGAGFIPGLYVGAGVGLTSGELFGLHVHRYWKSLSRVVDRNGQLAEPACGWCCVQGFPPNVTVEGVQVDCDEVFEDYAHRTVECCAAA